MSAVEVREARDDGERAAAMAIRHAVFVGEQDVPEELELDGRDGEAVHLVALRDGAVVATCRLLAGNSAVHLGRLAVDASARRQGIAARMLRAAEAWARAHGAARLALSAQTYATGLYLAAGYRAVGEPYMDAGIEHVDMELDLG
jgi:predicted GNAT family N-acyltransferase